MTPPIIEVNGEIVSNPLPCFKCDKQLEGAAGPDVVNQPYGGTVFSSRGQYGSTVFDPVISGKTIEITICDECIREKTKKRKVLFVLLIEQQPLVEHYIFNPESEGYGH